MQHIVHIFIGDDLISFRDKFAESFRKLHSDFEGSLFTAISLTKDSDGKLILCPDDKGDSLDGASIDKDVCRTGLFNYFENLYSRKVTVAHPGNQSMVVILWTKLYTDNVIEDVRSIVDVLHSCESNFHIEMAGFTHDAVSCFITDPMDRLAPDVYRKCFDDNISALRKIRPSIDALRLIANKNMENVSLDLNEDSMARICAEFAALMCENYLSVHKTVIESEEFPFESFGISSIIFDLEYYKTYIRNRIIIERILQQNPENPIFNINALANKTNPVLKSTLDSIRSFYSTSAVDAAAGLAVSGGTAPSAVVAKIDDSVKDEIEKLKKNIDNLLRNGEISIFESEALLSLILGDDCAMFDSSSVDANEIIIDDIIDESADFFISLDPEHKMLKEVSQKELKKIRNSMRNIAVANRYREQQLATLNIQQADDQSSSAHLKDNEYRFGGVDYKVDLNIDSEPLEKTYEAHEVRSENIDLRSLFLPIRNQGRQGSCASFAVSSVIEALRHDKQRYSPAFIYWNARKRRSVTLKDSGASLYDVIKSVTEKGICDESLMPYNQDIYNVAPSQEAEANAEDCKILEAKTVKTDPSDIKSALEDGYPVLVASRVFDSFSDTRSGFIKHPSSSELSNGERKDGHGCHAMVVCGFSDKEKVFVVRNSWGTEFGDKGYCYIPYSYAKNYFLQACIITKVTESDKSDHQKPGKETIKFNMNDNNIQVAILQNLIEEDRIELETQAEESNRMRSEWAQNIAVLGNVNNQSALVKNAHDELDKEIEEQRKIISNLQYSESQKIAEYKKDYIIRLIVGGVITLLTWVVVYFFHNSSLPWIIAGICTALWVTYFINYEYRWRKYRQELRDEITRHSNSISRIQAKKSSLDIKGHIHGTILKETEKYRSWLLSEYQKLHSFNGSVEKLYGDTVKEQAKMSPEVPYPFRAVLTNGLLDKYFEKYKHKMLDSIHWAPIFENYSIGKNLSEIVENDPALNATVMRGLRNFTMKHYVNMLNRDKWPFLPDSDNMSEIIPDLDKRAIPFCPYNPQGFNAMEKYILAKDLNRDEMQPISPYFTQAPAPISISNPYTVSILNIVRYNLPSR